MAVKIIFNRPLSQRRRVLDRSAYSLRRKHVCATSRVCVLRVPCVVFTGTWNYLYICRWPFFYFLFHFLFDKKNARARGIDTPTSDTHTSRLLSFWLWVKVCVSHISIEYTCSHVSVVVVGHYIRFYVSSSMPPPPFVTVNIVCDHYRIAKGRRRRTRKKNERKWQNGIEWCDGYLNLFYIAK